MRGEMLERAAELVCKYKVSVLPLIPGSKRPANEWQKYQSVYPTVAEMLNDWPTDANIGIVTGSISNLVVVDCESLEDATWFWHKRGKTTMSSQTPRGYHLYFQHPREYVMNAQRVRDERGVPRYDVRGDGGYVVAPPSKVIEGPDVKATGEYRWIVSTPLINPDDIPVFQTQWRPEASGPISPNNKKVKDGIAYIEKIRAVSGSGGQNDTWRALNRLKDSGLSSEECLAAILEWNETNADPKWKLPELLRKVQQVYNGK